MYLSNLHWNSTVLWVSKTIDWTLFQTHLDISYQALDVGTSIKDARVNNLNTEKKKKKKNLKRSEITLKWKPQKLFWIFSIKAVLKYVKNEALQEAYLVYPCSFKKYAQRFWNQEN